MTSEIQCSRCGTCCIDPVLPLNDFEVRKLHRHTGMPLSKFVTFYSFDDLDWPEDAEEWIEFRQGKKILGMKKRRGRCIFLNAQGCSVYPIRPRVCRMFPLDINQTENGTFEVERQPRVTFCKAVVKNDLGIRSKLIRYKIACDRSDEIFFRKVALWNKTNSRGTMGQFLAYLGF